MGTILVALVLMQQIPVAVTTVAQGEYSGVEEPQQVVVRTSEEWRKLWREHAGDEAAPEVDFTREMVAAVFAGTRPTGGYSVEIVSATRGGDTVTFEYREQRPSPDALLTQALTSPFHIVRVARHEGPVTFRATPDAAK